MTFYENKGALREKNEKRRRPVFVYLRVYWYFAIKKKDKKDLKYLHSVHRSASNFAQHLVILIPPHYYIR